jgi:class 3 adenylate cyclase
MDNQIANHIKNIMNTSIEVLTEQNVLIESQIPKGLKVVNLEASVLFVDIRDSTSLAKQLKIKNMTKLYHIFSRIVAKAANDNYGRIVQFTGDGFMAAFVNKGNNTSGENAFNAVLDIYSLLKDTYKVSMPLEYHFDCGYGIAHGHIYMTRLKSKKLKLQSFGIFPGDATNLASKLCDSSKPNEVLMDNEVHKMVKPKNAKEEEYKGMTVWRIRLNESF